ncbi:pickpocket protein 28-like, partial [Asbolus verrucosus]
MTKLVAKSISIMISPMKVYVVLSIDYLLKTFSGTRKNDVTYLNHTFPKRVYDWSPERGFPNDSDGDMSTIPIRPSGGGTNLGLTVVVDVQSDNYFCSSTNSIGFKIILSNPTETPKIADYGFLVSPGVEARYIIKPEIRQATPSLRGVSVEKRQCFFQDERPLHYYRSSCNCLPSCFEMNFDKSATYSTLFSLKSSYQIENVTDEYFRKNMAVLHFFFKETKFRKQIKTNVGGLLGLCLGFSFLSLVEIAYFLTLKVLCGYFHARKKGPKKRKENERNTNSVIPFMS